MSKFLHFSLLAGLAGLAACQFIGRTTFDVGHPDLEWVDRAAAFTADGSLFGAVYEDEDGFAVRLFTGSGLRTHDLPIERWSPTLDDKPAEITGLASHGNGGLMAVGMGEQGTPIFGIWNPGGRALYTQPLDLGAHVFEMCDIASGPGDELYLAAIQWIGGGRHTVLYRFVDGYVHDFAPLESPGCPAVAVDHATGTVWTASEGEREVVAYDAQLRQVDSFFLNSTWKRVHDIEVHEELVAVAARERRASNTTEGPVWRETIELYHDGSRMSYAHTSNTRALATPRTGSPSTCTDRGGSLWQMRRKYHHRRDLERHDICTQK